MSAYLVDREHIDTIVTAACAWEVILPSEADILGQVLWTANLLSVATRYPGDRSGDRPGPIGLTDDEIQSYTFTPVPGLIDPDVVACAVSCLGYQACEHSSWEDGASNKILARLAEIAAIRKRDHDQRFGRISAREWEISDRQVFERAAANRAAARGGVAVH